MSDKELEKIHKALANRRRIAILRYLQDKKDADLPALAEYIHVSYKMTSKHIGQLLAAGILDKNVRFGVAFFSISKTPPNLVVHTFKFF